MSYFAYQLGVLKSRAWHLPEWIAWGLLALWAVIWIVFSIVAGITELGDVGLLALLTHLLLPLLIVAVLLLCWQWPVIGAGAAVLASFILMLRYGFGNWFVVALLDVPPLTAGILLMVAWLKYSAELTLGPPDPPDLS